MSPTRRTVLFLAIGALVLGFWWRPRFGSASRPPLGSIVVSDGPFPRTVQTPGLPNFKLATPPQRILPTNASVVDSLVDLISADRVVALPKEAFTYSTVRHEEGPWSQIDILNEFAAEDTLSVKPDLVITHTWQSDTTIRILRDAGVPVLELPVVTTWEGLLETLRILGLVLGEEVRSRALIDDLETRRQALADQASNLTILPYTNWGTGGYTAGANSTWDLMIQLAGARNAASEYGLSGNVQIEFEELLEIDPDVFLLGIDPDSGRSRSADLLRNEEALARLQAVRSGRLIVMPAALYNASSHRLLSAAEALASQLEKLPQRASEASQSPH